MSSLFGEDKNISFVYNGEEDLSYLASEIDYNDIFKEIKNYKSNKMAQFILGYAEKHGMPFNLRNLSQVFSIEYIYLQALFLKKYVIDDSTWYSYYYGNLLASPSNKYDYYVNYSIVKRQNEWKIHEEKYNLTVIYCGNCQHRACKNNCSDYHMKDEKDQ